MWQTEVMPYWFDGNNIIGIPSAADRGARERRREFLAHLSTVAAARGGRFVVFFDGDDQDRLIPPRGVQVRYSAPLSADDEIVRRLEGLALPGEVIVVTNDRALASRCAAAGSRTRSWRDFDGRTARLPPGPHRGGEKEKPEQRIDVDDWLGFFGVDDGDPPA